MFVRALCVYEILLCVIRAQCHIKHFYVHILLYNTQVGVSVIYVHIALYNIQSSV